MTCSLNEKIAAIAARIDPKDAQASTAALILMLAVTHRDVHRCSLSDSAAWAVDEVCGPGSYLALLAMTEGDLIGAGVPA